MADSKKGKKRHLGRGLEALLGPITSGNRTDSPPAGGDKSVFPPDEAVEQAVKQLDTAVINPNPYQPRTSWDEEQLGELADSIRENGILQPILVRPAGEGYEVIAGERRLRAAEIAGLSKVPALVRDAEDAELLELALVENIHRADLNPIERAMAYQEFISKMNLTQAEAAKRLGEDRSVVANYLRLLDLPATIKQMLIDGSLSMGHARAILGLPTEELRRKLANRALVGRLSVREVERLVRRYLSGREDVKTAVVKAPHIADLEKRISEILGTKVLINAQKNGRRGRIIIEFYSLDEFDKLTERMGLGDEPSM